jgi:hypothetical protein
VNGQKEWYSDSTYRQSPIFDSCSEAVYLRMLFSRLRDACRFRLIRVAKLASEHTIGHQYCSASQTYLLVPLILEIFTSVTSS